MTRDELLLQLRQIRAGVKSGTISPRDGMPGVPAPVVAFGGRAARAFGAAIGVLQGLRDVEAIPQQYHAQVDRVLAESIRVADIIDDPEMLLDELMPEAGG